MRNMVLCVAERPANRVATQQPQLGTSRNASRERHASRWTAASFILLRVKDILYQLIRSGVLQGAGLTSKQIHAFSQALYHAMHGAVHGTVRMYEFC